MRLRTIRDRTMSSALERVRRELGPDALVLETHEGDDGVEVVAAEAGREPPEEGIARLRAELALLRRELKQATPPRPGRPAVAPRLEPVVRRLEEQGVGALFIARVRDILADAPPEEGDPIDPATSDWARRAVAGLLPGVARSRGVEPRCFAFVGPPGAGKSTTLAKVLLQTRQPDSVGVVTLDDRPGADRLVAQVAERAGIPFVRARGRHGLAEAFERIGAPRRVLVDTAGRGAREAAALEALAERLRGPVPIAVHLVLPANLEPTACLETARSYQALSPRAVVFTKLDECWRHGPLIDVPCTLDRPIAALAYGQRVDADLVAAQRWFVADLVLGRRRLAPDEDAR